MSLLETIKFTGFAIVEAWKMMAFLLSFFVGALAPLAIAWWIFEKLAELF